MALYTVFTIEEILHYFGRLYSMTSVEVNARIEFLTTFLELPEPKKLIKNLRCVFTSLKKIAIDTSF